MSNMIFLLFYYFPFTSFLNLCLGLLLLLEWTLNSIQLVNTVRQICLKLVMSYDFCYFLLIRRCLRLNICLSRMSSFLSRFFYYLLLLFLISSIDTHTHNKNGCFITLKKILRIFLFSFFFHSNIIWIFKTHERSQYKEIF